MAEYVDLACSRKALQYLWENIGGFNPWGMPSGILRLTKALPGLNVAIALHNPDGSFVASMGTKSAVDWRAFFKMDEVPHKRVLEWYDFNRVLEQLYGE